MNTFKELGIENRILNAISEIGFEVPTPVQSEVIPLILKNDSDLVGLAQTGTGKTAAFGLPIIQLVNAKANYPQALILSPTRELCNQIAEDLSIYSKYVDGIKVLAVYGGASIETQIRALRSGVQIIVATPGRMLDLIKRGEAKVNKIKWLVLDESDEMLNMGFQEELNQILENIPEERYTYLFSATMPSEVASIASNYMNNPQEVTIGRKNSGAENVGHYYYVIHAKDRYLALKRIIDYYPDIYAIVFCRTRMETQDVADLLIKDGYNAGSLHGDLSQAQRDIIMNRFKNKNLQILCATDVAARGIDVDNLTHIINYNLPDENESYTHRSGRTGRAGKSGISIALINLREIGKIRRIEKQLGKRFIEEKVPNGRQICEKQMMHMINKIKKVDVNYEEIKHFLPAIYEKLENLTREEIIQRFVSVEFNRFLEYYKNAKDLNVDDRREKSEYKKTTRLFINLGKMDNINTHQLIRLIKDNIVDNELHLSKIDVLNSFSFFEVAPEFSETVISACRNVKFNNRSVRIEYAENKNNSDRRENYSDKDKENYSRDKSSSRSNSYSNKKSYSDNSSDRGFSKERKSYSDKSSTEKKGYSDKKSYSKDKPYSDKNKSDKRKSSSDFNAKDKGKRRKRYDD